MLSTSISSVHWVFTNICIFNIHSIKMFYLSACVLVFQYMRMTIYSWPQKTGQWRLALYMKNSYRIYTSSRSMKELNNSVIKYMYHAFLKSSKEQSLWKYYPGPLLGWKKPWHLCLLWYSCSKLSRMVIWVIFIS